MDTARLSDVEDRMVALLDLIGEARGTPIRSREIVESAGVDPGNRLYALATRLPMGQADRYSLLAARVGRGPCRCSARPWIPSPRWWSSSLGLTAEYSSMASVLTTSDGTDLALETTGTGAPVVFVHGSNGGLDSWADIGRRLSGHQVVRYARRNHPPSAVGATPNSFAVEAGGSGVRAEVSNT